MTTTHTQPHASSDMDLPTPGVWQIDPGHTEVAFIGRHFGLTEIRGRFLDVDGTVTIVEPVENSSIDVTIGMASVSSGDASRDDHLRSDDFFDVTNHPEAVFRSTGFSVNQGEAAKVTGELTIKGVTRNVELEVEFLGQLTDPWGGRRAIFHAEGSINREDWGLTWNMVLDAGGLLVSKSIRLDVNVELVLVDQ